MEELGLTSLVGLPESSSLVLVQCIFMAVCKTKTTIKMKNLTYTGQFLIVVGKNNVLQADLGNQVLLSAISSSHELCYEYKSGYRSSSHGLFLRTKKYCNGILGCQ